MHVCFCCVWFSFFGTMPRYWLGRSSPRWPIVCPVGRKMSTQSVTWSSLNFSFACYRCHVQKRSRRLRRWTWMSTRSLRPIEKSRCLRSPGTRVSRICRRPNPVDLRIIHARLWWWPFWTGCQNCTRRRHRVASCDQTGFVFVSGADVRLKL